MTVDVSVPQWAANHRTFVRVSLLAGFALALIIALIAAVEPEIPLAVARVIFFPIGVVAVFIALPVISLRLFLARDPKQDVAPSRTMLAYVLTAIPWGVAVLLLGGLAVLAFVLEMAIAPALGASAFGLFGAWVVFSLIAKTYVNVQFLLQHWASR